MQEIRRWTRCQQSSPANVYPQLCRPLASRKVPEVMMETSTAGNAWRLFGSSCLGEKGCFSLYVRRTYTRYGPDLSQGLLRHFF